MQRVVIGIFQFTCVLCRYFSTFHPGFKGEIDFILMRKVQIHLHTSSKQGGVVPCLYSFNLLLTKWYYVLQYLLAIGFWRCQFRRGFWWSCAWPRAAPGISQCCCHLLWMLPPSCVQYRVCKMKSPYPSSHPVSPLPTCLQDKVFLVSCVGSSLDDLCWLCVHLLPIQPFVLLHEVFFENDFNSKFVFGSWKLIARG